MEINKLYCIDVLKGMRQLENNSINTIIADPPLPKLENGVPTIEYVNFNLDWIEEAYRVLKDTGMIYIIGHPEYIQHIGVHLTCEQRWVIWNYKNKNKLFEPFFQRSFEVVLVLWKDKKKTSFNKDPLREEYGTYHIYNRAKAKSREYSGRFAWLLQRKTFDVGSEKGAQPRDIFNFPTVAAGTATREHLSYCKRCDELIFPKDVRKHKKAKHKIVTPYDQKPIELGYKLILSNITENETGTILVPFVGSGPEIVGALLAKQNYIGFDNDPDMIAIATKKAKLFST